MILWMISAVIAMVLMTFGYLIGSEADKMSDLYGFCRLATKLGMVLLTLDVVILFIMDVMGVI